MIPAPEPITDRCVSLGLVTALAFAACELTDEEYAILLAAEREDEGDLNNSLEAR